MPRRPAAFPGASGTVWGMQKLPRSLTLAVITGAVELSRPADWSPRLRRAYVAVPGIAIGAISAAAVLAGSRKGRKLAAAETVDLVTPFTSGTEGTAADSSAAAAGDGTPTAGSAPRPSYLTASPDRRRKPVLGMALAGLAVGTGAAVSGIMALTLVLDERAETWLVRRGAAHPRLVMAVVAAVSSLALDIVMDWKDAKHAKEGADGNVSRTVPPHA